MRVLVTGGAGFIGSHVVDALLGAGHEVFIIDNFSTGKMENLPADTSSFKVQNGSILNDGMLRSNFDEFEPEVVVHLAAQSAISESLINPDMDMVTNGIGTLKLLQQARSHDVKRFILASTSAVYRYIDYGSEKMPTHEGAQTGPDTPYGISKLAAEGYAQTLFSNSIILRFGNVIGPRQVPIGENQVLSRMIRNLKYGDKFAITGSGKQKRDFINVWDVALAILQSLDGKPGTYNIATGEAHSVNEMAKIVKSRYGAERRIWLHSKTEDPRQHVCLDISRAFRELNWVPNFSFEQTINETIDWWESL